MAASSASSPPNPASPFAASSGSPTVTPASRRLDARTAWLLVRTSAQAWIDDYAPSMGAALAYYTVFSMAPLLLIVVSVAGLLFGPEAVRGELFGELTAMIGPEASSSLESLLASVSKPMEGITGTVIGIGVLLFGATTVFAELQSALDRIWRAPARDASGLWSVLRARLLSFSLILALAFMLLVSLVIGATVAALGRWWGGAFPGWETVVQVANLLFGYVITTLIFALIYKFMPRAHVHWRDVWLGALVTAALFTIGKFLIGLYIGKSGVASGYGAAGSLVVVLLWVYYSAQIFLLGAEFTWVYARTLGSLSGKAPAPSFPAPASGPSAAAQAPASAAPLQAAAARSTPRSAPPPQVRWVDAAPPPLAARSAPDRTEPSPDATRATRPAPAARTGDAAGRIGRVVAGLGVWLVGRALIRRVRPRT